MADMRAQQALSLPRRVQAVAKPALAAASPPMSPPQPVSQHNRSRSVSMTSASQHLSHPDSQHSLLPEKGMSFLFNQSDTDTPAHPERWTNPLKRVGVPTERPTAATAGHRSNG